MCPTIYKGERGEGNYYGSRSVKSEKNMELGLKGGKGEENLYRPLSKTAVMQLSHCSAGCVMSSSFLQSWDAALAKTAKAWAEKCKFEHNIYLKTPGKVHPTFTPVGENIWTGTASIFSVDEALRDWFNEVRSYDFNTNRCTGMCGHYTQVSPGCSDVFVMPWSNRESRCGRGTGTPAGAFTPQFITA